MSKILQKKCYVKLFKEDLFLNKRHSFCGISNDLVKYTVKAESVMPNGKTVKPLHEKEDVVSNSQSDYITPDTVSCNSKMTLKTIKEGSDDISENDSHVGDEDSCSDWEADFSRKTGVSLKKYCKFRKSETILNSDEEKTTSPQKIVKIQEKNLNDNDTNTLRTNHSPNKLSQPYVQLNRKTNGANNSAQFGTSLNKKSYTQNPVNFHKIKLSCFRCDNHFFSFNTLFEHLTKVHNLHDIQLVQPTKKSTSINTSHRKVIHAPREQLKENISSDNTNSSTLPCPLKKEKNNKVEKEGMSIVRKTKNDENENMLMCKKCGKLYVLDEYAYHLKYSSCSRQRPKRFQCDICGVAFVGLEKLNDHINSHTNKRPFKCTQCEKRFNSKGARYMHAKNMHQKKRTVHVCCYCGYTHTYLRHLLQHEQTHLLPEGAKLPTPFRCQECGKEFISKFILKVHERNHKLLKCPKCPELFKDREHRYKHLDRVHKTVKEFKCNVCNKVFRSRRCFRLHHKFVHSTVLSFFCDICDKGFKQKHHVEQHLITHSDYRPIVCPECGETFKRKTHLRQHKAAFHGDGKKR